MLPQNLIITIVLTAIFVEKHTDAYCIPCPRPGITLSSFTNCECPLNQFYNEDTNSCVPYIQCPIPPHRNPLPELKALLPSLPSLPNTMDLLSPSNPPKDLILVIKALNKRIDAVKRNIPSLLGPIVATVALKNKDLFETCDGNVKCVIREALKREKNYEVIFPKLKNVFNSMIKIFYGIFDDLKKMVKESCVKPTDCPAIRGLLKFREFFPGNFEELRDLIQIGVQVNKYFLKELKP
ncbi:uncharacterized protein LOC107397733 [Tribolium castaneum]|uniref:Uncharacterized protein n=1 Tax=Tribolium castaneum TaxID=7070 RepID=D2A3A0_TRICA|nr:PREDICTED: uncharacterized protein LOC107397733 [Tribolium castaneum]EFA02283.1 hypothetical protein TcasGA2_TC007947 [Tribolium castaneum]|eukprot:XP_015834423.1 PREDICTED: uncharacterized protein LOC107397733 [Tribolium castaneum]